MNETLFKLAQFINTKNTSLRSHFYRHRRILTKYCGEMSGWIPIESEHELEFVNELAKYGPLQESDLERSRESISRRYRTFPQDSKFFQMLLKQRALFRNFKNKSVEEFILSREGRTWLSSRTQMTRIATFELDRPYKRTKASARRHEEQIRQIIRLNPLLAFSDLRRMGARNLQPIWERFPHHENHRKRALDQIEQQLNASLKG